MINTDFLRAALNVSNMTYTLAHNANMTMAGLQAFAAGKFTPSKEQLQHSIIASVPWS